MSVFKALAEIERKLTQLADCGYGNPYGELGDCNELIVMLADGTKWEEILEFVKEQEFDGYGQDEI